VSSVRGGTWDREPRQLPGWSKGLTNDREGNDIVEVESPETGAPLPDSYQVAPPLK